MNHCQSPTITSKGALILMALAVLTNCRADVPKNANIGYLNISASLPLFVAETNGYFADENIQVTTQQAAASNQLVDGLLAGTLDAFVEASAVPVFAVELQSPGSMKVFSVSSITKEAPFDALLVQEDAPLRTLQNLRGTRIGVFPGSTATNLLRKFLLDRGVDASAITFLSIPAQDQLTALLEGSIDALHAYEPTVAIALTRGDVRQLYGSVYAEMLDPNPQGVAAVSTRFLQKDPSTANGVIRALERAMAFMRERDTESREILSRRMNLDRNVAERSVFLYMLPHREIDGSVFQAYADMLTELGELDGRVIVDNLVYRD